MRVGSTIANDFFLQQSSVIDTLRGKRTQTHRRARISQAKLGSTLAHTAPYSAGITCSQRGHTNKQAEGTNISMKLPTDGSAPKGFHTASTGHAMKPRISYNQE